MVEEQCGISRPFRDAVKQTLDLMQVTLFSTVWGTQQLILVCGTTLPDNQLSLFRSFYFE